MKLKDVGTDSCRYWQKAAVPMATLSLIALLISPSVSYATQQADRDNYGCVNHSNDNDNEINCDVVIIGGGPGGVHTAYQLATKQTAIPGNKVCLFEKEDRLGGRVFDVVIGRNGEKIPTGAMRTPKEHYTYGLLQELGIPTLNNLGSKTLIGVLNPNGSSDGLVFRNSIDDFSSEYYGDPTFGSEEGLTAKLICGANVPKIATDDPVIFVPDLENTLEAKGKSISEYAKSTNVLGPVGYALLQDTSTFRADFKAPVGASELDALSYLRYLENDWSAGGYVYPVPGFSALIKKMANKADNKGVRFYMNQGIVSINEQSGVGQYKLKLKTSKNKTVNAKKVIIATDAGSLKNNIGGTIANAIKNKDEFKYAEAGHAYTIQITVQWNDKWWDKVDANNVQYASHPQAELDLDDIVGHVDDDPLKDPIYQTKIQRAGMNINLGDGFCITRTEMATSDHWNTARVTRAAYIDDPACAKKWNDLYQTGGKKAVEKKLLEAYKILFPKVFDKDLNQDYVANNGRVKVVELHLEEHKHAWSALGKGAWNPAHGKNITNQSLWDWSVQPLPGKNVYLVGDAYVVTNGWSAGAYMSSVRVLQEKFGMSNLPKLTLNYDPSVTYPTFNKVKCECKNGTGNDCGIKYPPDAEYVE